MRDNKRHINISVNAVVDYFLESLRYRVINTLDVSDIIYLIKTTMLKKLHDSMKIKGCAKWNNFQPSLLNLNIGCCHGLNTCI